MYVFCYPIYIHVHLYIVCLSASYISEDKLRHSGITNEREISPHLTSPPISLTRTLLTSLPSPLPVPMPTTTCHVNCSNTRHILIID